MGIEETWWALRKLGVDSAPGTGNVPMPGAMSVLVRGTVKSSK